MGAKRFRDKLQEDGQIKTMFDSGELNDARCSQIVQSFRRTYPKTKQLWADLDLAVQNAVEGGQTAVGRIGFSCEHKDLVITLTSSRAQRYSDIRWDYSPKTIDYLDEDGDEQTFSPDSPQVVYGNGSSLYGGKITENVVQAIARDIFVDAMLEIETRGLRVAFHIHDEAVVEVPDSSVILAAATIEEILSLTPEWAPGLPIACEIQVASRFGK